MCTIGTVFDASVVHSFKQCDLTDPTVFIPPETRTGKAGPYLALTRKGRPGLWAGGNVCGVTFTAADNYTREIKSRNMNGAHRLNRTNSNQEEVNDSVDALFRAYESSIADYNNATDAAASLSKFYMNGTPENPGHFDGADIALFADHTQSIYMEYSPTGDFTFDAMGNVIDEAGTPEVRTVITQIHKKDAFNPAAASFVSTNNGRLFNTAVTYPMNLSTYLRLNRAELLMLRDPSHAGIHAVLKDQYYGKTDISICRVATKPGQFYTQASVIFTTLPQGIACEYVINGNPRTKPWEKMTLNK